MTLSIGTCDCDFGTPSQAELQQFCHVLLVALVFQSNHHTGVEHEHCMVGNPDCADLRNSVANICLLIDGVPTSCTGGAAAESETI